MGFFSNVGTGVENFSIQIKYNIDNLVICNYAVFIHNKVNDIDFFVPGRSYETDCGVTSTSSIYSVPKIYNADKLWARREVEHEVIAIVKPGRAHCDNCPFYDVCEQSRLQLRTALKCPTCRNDMHFEIVSDKIVRDEHIGYMSMPDYIDPEDVSGPKFSSRVFHLDRKEEW